MSISPFLVRKGTASRDGLILSAGNIPDLANCLGVFRMPAGQIDQTAVRHQSAELMYVAEGSGELRTESATIPFTRGDALSIPPLAWHWLANTGAEEIVSVFCFPTPERPLSETQDVKRLLQKGGTNDASS